MDEHNPVHRSTEPILEAIRARTPARILVGRSGPGYRTATQLALRVDHAAALDAVHAELDLVRDLGREFVDRWRLFEVASRAGSKAEYLMRPDLGRRLADESLDQVARLCPRSPDLQVIIGDGLSAAAVGSQVPALLPLLEQGAGRLGWRFGRPFFVRHCRVGVLNDVGAALGPEVAVLLIGERPGLATAESLSAYMAFRPATGQTDAHRNLISNIHARGLNPSEAALRILALADRMRRAGSSGASLKEDLGAPSLPAALGPREENHEAE